MSRGTPRWLPAVALLCAVLGLAGLAWFFLVPASSALVEVLFAAAVLLLVSAIAMGSIALLLHRRRGEPTGLAGAAILVAASPVLLVAGVWLLVVLAGGSL